jgi:hypothetical protein
MRLQDTEIGDQDAGGDLVIDAAGRPIGGQRPAAQRHFAAQHIPGARSARRLHAAQRVERRHDLQPRRLAPTGMVPDA